MSRICIFSKSFDPDIGGLETIARILATQGSKMGHEIEVVTDSRTLSDDEDAQKPFRVVRTRSLFTRVRVFRRADAVLFMNVSLHGYVAARLAGVPIVFSHHGLYGARSVPQKYLDAVKKASTQSHPNISVSHFVARHIPAESVVVHNAYESALFRQGQSRVRVRDFAFLGRLVSDKGADLCLRSLARAQNEGLRPTLTIIGDGPERPMLETLAGQLALREQVHFTGRMVGSALVAELQKHACMVVPSLWEEPFGIVALEGLACCDTVIVTSRGGLPEAVGTCGVVVDPDEESLATAMLSVARMRRAGGRLPGEPTDEERERHLAIHGPASVARQYFDVIEAVIASKQTGMKR